MVTGHGLATATGAAIPVAVLRLLAVVDACGKRGVGEGVCVCWGEGGALTRPRSLRHFPLLAVQVPSRCAPRDGPIRRLVTTAIMCSERQLQPAGAPARMRELRG